MSLTAKYRPSDFEHFVGNAVAVNKLRAVLDSGDCPRVMMFAGPSGTGKTTLARIVAQAIGCHKSDLMELNTADYRTIDDARDLGSKVRLAPMFGKVRCWIMDEVHGLTPAAQEVLLKVLEEPPAHAYFMLATTDPQKLKPTFRSRCMTFELQSIGEKQIGMLLRDILEQERKSVPDDVLDQICQDCLGSARDAVTILESVMNLPERQMLTAARKSASDQQASIDLCRALIRRARWGEVAKILSALEADPEQVRMAVLGYCRAILLKEQNDTAFLVMDSFKDPFYNTGQAGLVRACYEAVNK